jgi:hypothetical protein
VGILLETVHFEHQVWDKKETLQQVKSLGSGPYADSRYGLMRTVKIKFQRINLLQ